jgi:hypothetical protein
MDELRSSCAKTNVMPHSKKTRHKMNRPTNHMIKSQRLAKLKEVQANTQNQRFCTTFNFAQMHQSPPTTPRQLQNIKND